jgi:hypothetical protein
MRYPDGGFAYDAVEGLPDELSDFNLAADGRIDWLLRGERAGKQHYFASAVERGVCPQWGTKLWFAEVPASHLELFELADEEPLHWHFGDRLHVFVDGAAARTGAFDPITWGTI